MTYEQLNKALKEGKKVAHDLSFNIVAHEGGPVIQSKSTGHLIRLTPGHPLLKNMYIEEGSK